MPRITFISGLHFILLSLVFWILAKYILNIIYLFKSSEILVKLSKVNNIVSIVSVFKNSGFLNIYINVQYHIFILTCLFIHIHDLYLLYCTVYTYIYIYIYIYYIYIHILSFFIGLQTCITVYIYTKKNASYIYIYIHNHIYFLLYPFVIRLYTLRNS